MLAVTIDSLPGYEIKEVIGEVLGVTARPQNVYAEGVKALSGQLNPQPRTLSRWRQDAIAVMVETAYRRGANAVVGMRFDHRAIGSTWTEICAYGTAVFVVPAGREGGMSSDDRPL
jgi:uncharacterized protein YbjQ (UPF0145 family)